MPTRATETETETADPRPLRALRAALVRAGIGGVQLVCGSPGLRGAHVYAPRGWSQQTHMWGPSAYVCGLVLLGAHPLRARLSATECAYDVQGLRLTHEGGSCELVAGVLYRRTTRGSTSAQGGWRLARSLDEARRTSRQSDQPAPARGCPADASAPSQVIEHSTCASDAMHGYAQSAHTPHAVFARPAIDAEPLSDDAPNGAEG